jgi:Xaa-Pro dipeptidase
VLTSTHAHEQCREWLDDAIDLVRPGATTDEIAAVWPTAQELGSATKRHVLACNSAMG